MTDGVTHQPPIERIRECGVLPVVEMAAGTDPVALVDALADGGITCVEITLRTAGALAAIETVRRDRPDILVVAGTVRTPAEADAAIDAGAMVLVSPGFSASVLERAVQHDTVYVPGVSTPTEIQMGLERGIRTFKFFPAEAAGGVRYLQAMRGPFPEVRFVPTGGIEAANLAGYLALPNVLACGGSWMVAQSVLEASDLDAVRRLAAEATAIVREVRAGSATEAPPTT